MIQFKYFFNSSIGAPDEAHVNSWLEEIQKDNNKIKIINLFLDRGCLVFFYEIYKDIKGL